MQTRMLYRYVRSDGGITVSPTKPDAESDTMIRLVADEGMILTDGISYTYCVDLSDVTSWYEVEDTFIHAEDVLEVD